jgi:hypothetical protein
MENDLENIQCLNGNKSQCSVYRDDFILRERERDTEVKGKEGKKRKGKRKERKG